MDATATLPDETLLSILHEASHLCIFLATTATMVCSRWRHLGRSSRILWTTLRLDQINRPLPTQALLARLLHHIFLARGRPLNLTMDVQLLPGIDAETVVALFTAYNARLCGFHLITPPQRIRLVASTEKYLRRQFTNNVHVSLAVAPNMGGAMLPWPAGAPRVLPTLKFASLPLRILSLQGAWSSRGTHEYTGDPTAADEIHDLLELLQSTPELLELRLASPTITLDPVQYIRPYPHINLNRLLRLEFVEADGCFISFLCDHLRTPSLSYLGLHGSCAPDTACWTVDRHWFLQLTATHLRELEITGYSISISGAHALLRTLSLFPQLQSLAIRDPGIYHDQTGRLFETLAGEPHLVPHLQVLELRCWSGIPTGYALLNLVEGRPVLRRLVITRCLIPEDCLEDELEQSLSHRREPFQIIRSPPPPLSLLQLLVPVDDTIGQ